MALIQWNLSTDPYYNVQLDNNWTKLDSHNHTSGQGIQIPAGGLAANSVGPAEIQDGVAIVQTGTIIMWPFLNGIQPVGYGTLYLACDGSQYSVNDFAALYAVIGTAYTTDPISSYFNVPYLASTSIVSYMIKT